MASAALTGRTMVELCLPGVTGYLEESFMKEPLGARLFHTLKINVVVCIAGGRPDTVAHSVTLDLCSPKGAATCYF